MMEVVLGLNRRRRGGEGGGGEGDPKAKDSPEGQGEGGRVFSAMKKDWLQLAPSKDGVFALHSF